MIIFRGSGQTNRKSTMMQAMLVEPKQRNVQSRISALHPNILLLSKFKAKVEVNFTISSIIINLTMKRQLIPIIMRKQIKKACITIQDKKKLFEH